MSVIKQKKTFKKRLFPHLFWICFLSDLMAYVITGCSGLGKSTLINTLFKTRAARTSCTPENAVIPKTVEIKSVTHGKPIVMLHNVLLTYGSSHANRQHLGPHFGLLFQEETFAISRFFCIFGKF